MVTTVLMLLGFVVGIVAILGVTPALERWATSAPARAESRRRRQPT